MSTFVSFYKAIPADKKRDVIRNLKRTKTKFPERSETLYANALKKWIVKRVQRYADYLSALYVPIKTDASFPDISTTEETPQIDPNDYSILPEAAEWYGNKAYSENKKNWEGYWAILLGLGISTKENKLTAKVTASLADNPDKATVKEWAKKQTEAGSRLKTKAEIRLKLLYNENIKAGKKPAKALQDAEAIALKKAQRYAELTARNEIGNLTADLTENRSRDAGLKKYTWETANDERVRGRPGGRFPNAFPSHWVMQGLICTYDDNTVQFVEGKWVPRPAEGVQMRPGDDWLCRCIAIPFWDDLNNL